MKKLIAMLLFSAISSINAVQAQSTIDDKWALVVGASNYKESSLNTTNCSENARKFHDFLTKDAGFAPDHCKLFTDSSATRTSVLRNLIQFFATNVRSNDLVVVYFSCASSPSTADPGQKSFLLLNDASIGNFYATGISMKDLVDLFKTRLACSKIFLVIDSESSTDSLSGSDKLRIPAIHAPSPDEGEFLITSGKLTKNGRNDNSIFTSKLINALKCNGKATSISDALKNFSNATEIANPSALISTIKIAAPSTDPRLVH